MYLAFAIRFFRNLSQLIQKIRLNPKFKNKNFINVLLKDLIIPHSFFNFIFLNKTEFENNKIPLEVLLHEQIHAKQKHALDILFIEIFQILFWFNPLLYFIKKDIKLNHEFLADQAVLKQGIDSSTYLNTLLKFSSPDNYRDASLANAINYSSIKKRFTVMKLKTPKTALWFRSLIILPLLAILIYGFSDTVIIEKEIITNTISAKQQIKTNVGATQSMMDEYNEFINKFEKSKSINFSKYKRIVAIYDLMTEMQRNSVKRYPEMPGTGLTKVKPKTPTNAIFNSWKNKEEFAIWIDGKHVENTLLNTYKATGFIYYTSSFVYNNARSERFPQPYQNSLFTKKGFEETYLKANVKKYNNLKNHFYKVKKEFIDSGNKDDSEIRLIKVQLDKLYNLLSKEEIEKYNVKSPKTLTFSNQNAQQENTSQLPSEDNKSKSSLKAVSKVKDIIIKIDRSKNIILNNKTILFKDLKKEVDKLNPDLSTEEKQKQLNGNIIIYSESFIKLAKEIKEILTKKCNVTNC